MTMTVQFAQDATIRPIRTLGVRRVNKAFDRFFNNTPNMITDVRVLCFATADNTLLFELSKGYFNDTLYWGVTTLRMNATGGMTKDLEDCHSTAQSSTIPEFIINLVRNNCNSESVSAMEQKLKDDVNWRL